MNRILLGAVACLGSLMLSSAAQAVTLAEYNWTNAGTVNSTTVDVVDSNVTASDLSWLPGGGTRVTSDGLESPGSGFPQFKKFGTSTDLQFTVTPDLGSTLNLSNLDFDLQMNSATGTIERRLDITSSLTGATVLHSIYNIAAGVTAGGGVDALTTQVFESRSIDLTSVTELQNTASPVTFNMTLVDVSTGSPASANFRMDDVVLGGTIGTLAPLATYEFGPDDGTWSTSLAKLPTNVQTDISASDWDSTGGAFVRKGQVGPGSDGGADGLVDNTRWKASSNPSPTPSFTLTPSSGKVGSYSGLSFDIQMDSSATGNKIRRLELKSDKTGDTPLYTLWNAGFTDPNYDPVNHDRLTNGQWNSKTVDLTSIPELQNVDGSVTFTLEFDPASSSPVSNTNIRIDNVAPLGSVMDAPPVPSLVRYDFTPSNPGITADPNNPLLDMDLPTSVAADMSAQPWNPDTQNVLNVALGTFEDSGVFARYDDFNEGGKPFGDDTRWKAFYIEAEPSFTVSADAGKMMNVDELSFEIQMDTQLVNRIRRLELKSSATGDTVLYTLWNTAGNTDPNYDPNNHDRLSNGQWQTRTIDLSGIPELQGIAGDVTFTFEFDRANSDPNFLNPTNLRVDSVELFGNIVDSDAGDGDFNHDGVVDGLDFLFWQRAGANPAALALWEANYGNTYSITSNATVVPEPTVGVLSLMAALSLAAVRRRQS